MDSNHDEAIHCFLALKDSLEVTDAELHIENDTVLARHVQESRDR